MHRLPLVIAVAVFDSADRARVLQATRHLDGHLTFRASSTILGDAPLLTDRLGLPADTLLFTCKASIRSGRDLWWHAADTSRDRVDLRVDESVGSLIRIADGPRLLAGNRDHAVPALIMAIALTRLAAALKLPLLRDVGIGDLLDWLPPRPLPPSLPPRSAPLTIMQDAFARASSRQKGH